MTNFENAYNNTHKTNAVKEWWGKNHLYVLRVVLFPIYLAELIADKIQKHNAKLNVWSEERAKDFCDKYLPRLCDKTESGFWLFNNGYGFTRYKAIRRNKKDYRFASVYQWDLFKYIKDAYEIEGYVKKVLDNEWNKLEVEWTKKEN